MPSGHYVRKLQNVTVSEARRLAELGAAIRVRELRAELARLLHSFPALADGSANGSEAPPEPPAETPAPSAWTEKRRRKMAKKMKQRWSLARIAEGQTPPTRKVSAATRRALSKGIAAYWAKKRAEKAAAAKAADNS